MKQVKVGILGMGNIGGGVATVLRENGKMIAERYGVEFEITRVLEKVEARVLAQELPASVRTEDIDDVIANADLIVEVLGGQEPAATFMQKALLAGKTVVTANKSALAPAWNRLGEAAKKTGAGLYYEASAGGAIPIVEALKHSLQASNVESVMGIINGTTNYMLCRMADAGLSYEDALKEAQEKGYAEPDPTYDVTGMDAVFKLSILSSIALGKHVSVPQIANDGITKVTADDIAFGKAMGLEMKLLGVCRANPDAVEAHVYPTFLPKEHMLSGVKDAFNAIFYHGDMSGDGMLYGRGAGSLPTAGAIVSDMIRASLNEIHEQDAFLSDPAFVDNAAAENHFFLRFKGSIGAVKAAFVSAGIKVLDSAEIAGECAVVVEPMTEKKALDLARETGRLLSIYRVEF